MPVLIGISLLTTLADKAGWLTRLETTALDAMLASAFPAQSDRTFLVVITEDDYHSIFEGRSPLSPEVLAQALESVAAARPRLVVVDIDTAADDFRPWADRPSLRGVVWARDAEVTDAGIELGRVLGANNPPGVRWGVAVLPADRDGVIRRYRRTFAAESGGRTVFRMPSLATAAVDALCSDTRDQACEDRTAAGGADDDLRVIRFAGSRTRSDACPRRRSSSQAGRAGGATRHRCAIRSPSSAGSRVELSGLCHVLVVGHVRSDRIRGTPPSRLRPLRRASAHETAARGVPAALRRPARGRQLAGPGARALGPAGPVPAVRHAG